MPRLVTTLGEAQVFEEDLDLLSDGSWCAILPIVRLSGATSKPLAGSGGAGGRLNDALISFWCEHLHRVGPPSVRPCVTVALPPSEP